MLLEFFIYTNELCELLPTQTDRKHTAPLFAKLGILDIFQVSGLQIAKFMFYYHKQLLPPMFLSLFCTSSQIHSYEARPAKSYRPHHFRTNLKQFTILYQGPKIWSSLSVSITGSTSFPTFKKKMRSPRLHVFFFYVLFQFKVANK